MQWAFPVKNYFNRRSLGTCHLCHVTFANFFYQLTSPLDILETIVLQVGQEITVTNRLVTIPWKLINLESSQQPWQTDGQTVCKDCPNIDIISVWVLRNIDFKKESQCGFGVCDTILHLSLCKILKWFKNIVLALTVDVSDKSMPILKMGNELHLCSLNGLLKEIMLRVFCSHLCPCK